MVGRSDVYVASTFWSIDRRWSNPHRDVDSNCEKTVFGLKESLGNLRKAARQCWDFPNPGTIWVQEILSSNGVLTWDQVSWTLKMIQIWNELYSWQLWEHTGFIYKYTYIILCDIFCIFFITAIMVLHHEGISMDLQYKIKMVINRMVEIWWNIFVKGWGWNACVSFSNSRT